MLRSQENYISRSPMDQLHAPQDEGPHENFAQLCVSRNQRSKLVITHFKKFAGRSYATSRQAAATRNHRQFAGKSSGLMFNDGTFTVQLRLHNLQASREQHEKRDVAFAWLKQDVAHFHLTYFTHSTNTIDLLESKSGKSFTTNVTVQRR